MIRRFVPALVLAVACLTPTSALAYSMTCLEAGAAATSSDRLLQGSVVGYALGTLDLLAGLHCFTGHGACNCLQGAARNDPSGFGRVYGQELAGCINRGEGNSPVFGSVIRAAQSFCSF